MSYTPTNINHFNGVPFADGYIIGARKPIDARMVVQNVAARNAIANLYYGLVVYCASEDKDYRYKGDPYESNSSIRNASWVELGNDTTDGINYKGTWDAAGNVPNIGAMPLSGFNNGDFYKVSVSGTSNVYNLSGMTFSVNDVIIYNGAATKWEYIPATSAYILPTIYYSDITNFEAGVATFGLQHWLQKNWPSGSTVYYTESTTDPVTSAVTVTYDIYKAKIAVPSTVSTPASIGANTYWELIVSNDYNKIVNRLVIANNSGLLSSLPTPLDNGQGKLLDAKEIDRRISSYQSNILIIDGGDAYRTQITI